MANKKELKRIDDLYNKGEITLDEANGLREKANLMPDDIDNSVSYKTSKEIFIENLNGYSTEDLLKEIIHRDEQRKFELEKIRSNTATLVNWLIAIPIILTILYYLLVY